MMIKQFQMQNDNINNSKCKMMILTIPHGVDVNKVKPTPSV